MRIIEERFLDMLEAIQRIEKYAGRGRQAFVADELIQTYIVHNLQILGEAAAKIPSDQQREYPELPWPKMIGMRNVLVPKQMLHWQSNPPGVLLNLFRQNIFLVDNHFLHQL